MRCQNRNRICTDMTWISEVYCWNVNCMHCCHGDCTVSLGNLAAVIFSSKSVWDQVLYLSAPAFNEVHLKEETSNEFICHPLNCLLTLTLTHLSLSRRWWFLQVSEHWAAGALVPDWSLPAILQGPRPPGHPAPRALAVWSGKHGTDPRRGAPALHPAALLVSAVLPRIPHWRAHHEVSTGQEVIFTV